MSCQRGVSPTYENVQAVIEIQLLGLPIPQGSLRPFKLARGYVMVATNAKRLKPWRLELKEAAAAALNGSGPSQDNVLLTIEFRFPRPAGHFGKRGLRPSAPLAMFRRPDLDKLVRAILDALTDAGACPDDGQVDEI